MLCSNNSLTTMVISSTSFISLLFTAAILASNVNATSAEDSSGFHGYERDALLSLKAGFNSSFLDTNWTGIMCYMNETPYWHGIQCVDSRVTGVILENMGIFGEIKVDAFVNLTELSNLSFKNNFITGNLMDFATNPKLRNIDLSENRFHGEIPSSLIYINSLESLILHDNKLTGPIPGFNQSTLKTFNVSNNNLSGAIPETKTLQSFSPSSYAGNEYLCGPPTPTLCRSRNDLSDQLKSENSSEDSNHNSHIEAIMIVVNVIVLVVVIFLLIIYYLKYKKLKKVARPKNISPKDEEDRESDQVVEKGKLVFMDNNGNINNRGRFELDDLLKASAEGLGRGNFGNCYKAMLEIGEAVVVKKLVDLKPLSSDEFFKQVTRIAGLKHPNLLPLLGCYYSKDEKLFLYRFAANGNVYNRLHGGRGTGGRVPFRWGSRLAVARGVARAVEYLHLSAARSPTTAPHGNLKPSNVLLGENDDVLVTDYGLTSLVAAPIAAQRMVAYKTPEYQSCKKISKKSDVWSYGSLLLELLTGRIPAHSAPPGTGGIDLCGWVNRAVREEWTAEIFDPEIAVQKDASKGMLRLLRVAMKCCENSPEKRPEISQVLAEVEEVEVALDSEDDELSYSSLDRSAATNDSLSATSSVVIADDRR
ncbi:hypothetical protein ABFS82_02G060800 [Erythranthe guttata]